MKTIQPDIPIQTLCHPLTRRTPTRVTGAAGVVRRVDRGTIALTAGAETAEAGRAEEERVEVEKVIAETEKEDYLHQ